MQVLTLSPGDRTVDAREFEALFRQLLPHASDSHVERAWERVVDTDRQVCVHSVFISVGGRRVVKCSDWQPRGARLGAGGEPRPPGGLPDT